MKQLSCDQCRERWDEYIDKSTFEAKEQFANVRAHLENCADCRKTFDLLAAARLEFQQLPAQKAPASLRANILHQIEQSPQPWWQSLVISPQRLAWASGAIMAVFVLALLMRPERQAEIPLRGPKVLSNRAQVEEHNQQAPQPSVAPAQKPSAQKSVSKKAPQKSSARPSSDLQKTVQKPAGDIKQPQKSNTPAPETPTDSPEPVAKDAMPKPAKITPQQRLEKQASKPPRAELRSAPVPKGNEDSAPQGQSAAIRNNAAGASLPESVDQQYATDRATATSPHGPQGSAASMHAEKSQDSPKIIHWSTTITSDYDVANAKITATLRDGLTFSGADSNRKERVLWRGTLVRGKQIPLNADLLRTTIEPAEIHLLMVNADSQKVLLEKTLKVD